MMIKYICAYLVGILRSVLFFFEDRRIMMKKEKIKKQTYCSTVILLVPGKVK